MLHTYICFLTRLLTIPALMCSHCMPSGDIVYPIEGEHMVGVECDRNG